MSIPEEVSSATHPRTNQQPDVTKVSPYTLASSDNPGAMISSVMLTGDNYNEWSTKMLNALQAKRKTGFINGSISKPPLDNPDYENWQAVNSMIVGWIRASIEPKVKSTVTFICDAHQLWSELKQRFSVGNKVHVHQIKTQLAACRQDGQPVIDYYGRLCKLWEEFQIYKPITVCKCGLCTCGATLEPSKEREEEKIHQFVLGLDDSRFGGLSATLIAMDPFPSLGEIYSRVVREEQRLASVQIREQQQSAIGFLTRQSEVTADGRTDSSIIKSRDRSVLCSHCGRSGHEKKDCWQIVGFPDWWTERTNGGGRGSSSRGRGGRSSGSNNSGRGRGQVTAAHATTSNLSPFPEFTPDQLRVITQMIQNKNNGTSDKLSGKMKLGDVILDTGASHHMTGQLSLLTNIVTIPSCSVGFADGRKTFAISMGTFKLSETVSLSNVLYVPALNCSLISVSKLVKQIKCLALFTDTICVLQDRFSRTLIGTGEERDGVYYLTDAATTTVHKVDITTDHALWHQRLGHPSFSVLSSLPLFSGSSCSVSSRSCDVCFRAKQTREVFPDSSNKSTDCFSLIHCDVWGPYRVPSSCGAVYFLTIVDDFSRSVWTYLLLAKSEVRSVLTNFLAYTEKQFGKSVKIIRSDNGTEFMCLSSYFKEQGIVHQTSCVGTPQQNGRVERKHRHILNVSRALLFQASLPIKFWGEAVMTAAYLINRTPSSIHNGLSPYELLHGCKPDYDQLRVFGSACYAHRVTRDKDKFGERSRLCIFVGYPFGQKGWKVYDLSTNEFIVSRDVVFRENVFPYATNEGDTIYTPPVTCPITYDEDWLPFTTLEDRGSDENYLSDPPVCVTNVSESDTEHDTPQSLPTPVDDPLSPSTSVTPTQTPTNSSSSTSPSTNVSPPQQDTTPIIENTPPRQGKRQVQQPARLKDYILYNASCTPNTPHVLSPSTSQSSSSIQGNLQYPLTDYISDECFSAGHKVFLAAITANDEPKHFKEDVKVKVWNDAMYKEVDALEVNKTWDIVDLPTGKVAIGSQWVYKTKFNADGTVERYKARLVVQGNNQIEGEDYTETFAPVVKMTTVRTLLRLVAANQWEVYQMDVHNAFLHGDLEEEVYMKLPPGFRHSHPDKVCRLRKSLYGLKQAPRCWFKKLSDALKRFGFIQGYEDYSFFSYSCKGIELRVLVYVDDLIICGNDEYMVQKFKEYLGRCFSMKDLGKLKYFLGIEVSRGPDAPREAHLEAAMRIVRYLKGSPGQGILLSANKDLTLEVYCDSDFQSCPLTRRSLSAYVVLLGGSPISWKTKKQDTVSHSSAEAEYRAMSVALKEIKWLNKLLKELGITLAAPTRLFCDSKAAISIAANPVFHERTKHIERDCHSVRDAVRDGIITTHHVRTSEQLADIFTKALGRNQFIYLMSKLGIQNLHTPT
uniref:Putative retroelement pol polyprotein n=1 Tax=Arabidopsis thaliana TaxID=3702 RepID=Q9ZVW0_ARATH|nr:putative retroelement pol polyprotein [Arabidopsis thaliana]